MAKALLNNVLRRVIAILNANPDAWSVSVSGEVGAFPYTEEITQAVFEADEAVAVNGYFQSVNQNLTKDFLTVSPNLTNGDALPYLRGTYGKVEVSPTGAVGTWKKAVRAKSLDDITNARAVGSYVQTGAFDHLYYIDNGNFYTASAFGRVEYPRYERSLILQCDQNEEFLIIATAVRFLTRNASSAPFAEYKDESVRGIQQLIQDGSYIPGVEVKQ